MSQAYDGLVASHDGTSADVRWEQQNIYGAAPAHNMAQQNVSMMQSMVMTGYGNTSPEPPPPGVECEPLPPGVDVDPGSLDASPVPDSAYPYAISAPPPPPPVADYPYEEAPSPLPKLEESPNSPADKPQVNKSKLLLSKAMAKKRLAAFSVSRNASNTDDDRGLAQGKKSVMKLPALSDARLNEVELEKQKLLQSEDMGTNDIPVEDVYHQPSIGNTSANLDEAQSSSISKPKFSLVRFTQADSPPPVITEKKVDYSSQAFGYDADDGDKQKVVVEWKKIADKSSKSLRTKSNSVEKSDSHDDKASHSDDKRESSYDDKRSRYRHSSRDRYRSSNRRDSYRRYSRSPSYTRSRRFRYNPRWNNRGRFRRFYDYKRYHDRSDSSPERSRYRSRNYKRRDSYYKRKGRSSSSDYSRSRSPTPNTDKKRKSEKKDKSSRNRNETPSRSRSPSKEKKQPGKDKESRKRKESINDEQLPLPNVEAIETKLDEKEMAVEPFKLEPNPVEKVADVPPKEAELLSMIVNGRDDKEIKWPLQFIKYTNTTPVVPYSCKIEVSLELWSKSEANDVKSSPQVPVKAEENDSNEVKKPISLYDDDDELLKDTKSSFKSESLLYADLESMIEKKNMTFSDKPLIEVEMKESDATIDNSEASKTIKKKSVEKESEDSASDGLEKKSIFKKRKKYQRQQKKPLSSNSEDSASESHNHSSDNSEVRKKSRKSRSAKQAKSKKKSKKQRKTVQSDESAQNSDASNEKVPDHEESPSSGSESDEEKLEKKKSKADKLKKSSSSKHEKSDPKKKRHSNDSSKLAKSKSAKKSKYKAEDEDEESKSNGRLESKSKKKKHSKKNSNKKNAKKSSKKRSRSSSNDSDDDDDEPAVKRQKKNLDESDSDRSIKEHRKSSKKKKSKKSSKHDSDFSDDKRENSKSSKTKKSHKKKKSSSKLRKQSSSEESVLSSYDKKTNRSSRKEDSKSSRKEDSKSSRKEDSKSSRREDSKSSRREDSKSSRKEDDKSSRKEEKGKADEDVTDNTNEKKKVNEPMQFKKHVISIDDSGQMGVIESFTDACIKEAKKADMQLSVEQAAFDAELAMQEPEVAKLDTDSSNLEPTKTEETAADAGGGKWMTIDIKEDVKSDMWTGWSDKSAPTASWNVEDMDIAESDDEKVKSPSNIEEVDGNNQSSHSFFFDHIDNSSNVTSTNETVEDVADETKLTAKQLLEKVKQKRLMKEENATGPLGLKLKNPPTGYFGPKLPPELEKKTVLPLIGKLPIGKKSQKDEEDDVESKSNVESAENEMLQAIRKNISSKFAVKSAESIPATTSEYGASTQEQKLTNQMVYSTTTMAPVMYNQNQPTWTQGQWVQTNPAWQTPMQAYNPGYSNMNVANQYGYAAPSHVAATHVVPESVEPAETQSNVVTKSTEKIASEEEPPPPPPGVELAPSKSANEDIVSSPGGDESDKTKDHGILIQYTRDKNVTCALGLDASKKSVKFSDGIAPGSQEAEQQSCKAEIRAISPAPPLPENDALTADDNSNEQLTSEDTSLSVIPPPPSSSPPPPPPPKSPPPPPPPATSAPVQGQTMQQQEYQYAAQYANPMYYQQQPYTIGYGYPTAAQPYDYSYQQAYMYQQGTAQMYYPVAPMTIQPQYQPPPGP